MLRFLLHLTSEKKIMWLFKHVILNFEILPGSFPMPLMWGENLYHLFHRRTRASYVYNECLAWYNVVLTHGSTQAWNS